MEFHSHILGVDHRVFGAAGVYAEAVYRHNGSGGVEVFVADFAHVLTVHGVGVSGAEARHVKQAGALADFLVGGKADAQLTVGALLGDDTLQRGHNFGNAGLVVGTQQGRAVGGDQGLPLHLGQKRENRRVQHGAGGGQYDLAAVVVFVDLGVDVLAGGVVGGVHVGNQTERLGVLAAGGGGQRGVDVAMLVHKGVGKTERLQLIDQLTCQVKLAHRAGMGAGVGVRGGVHLDILQ